MYSNSKLQTAVRLSLGMGAGALAVGFAPGALAQDASSADEPLEEIITTGSRIKRADLDSASPVTVIDREVLLAQGITVEPAPLPRCDVRHSLDRHQALL